MNSPDFSVRDVLTWARTKPADERYNYNTAIDCALCQFLWETGRVASPHVNSRFGGAATYADDDGRLFYYADELDAAALGCGPDDWTFGALADRLEALLPSEWTRAESYLSEMVSA